MVRTSRGFTLIELLIVVAIIAILAAIAVPNLLEAQTRSKVSRAKADMRTLATALEAYAVDNNTYPPMYTHRSGNTNTIYLFIPDQLSTPVAYVTAKNTFKDVFKHRRPNNPGSSGSTDPTLRDYYNYVVAKQIQSFGLSQYNTYPLNQREDRVGHWELYSYGPDMMTGPYVTVFPGRVFMHVPYDPTNGTVSWGDVRRSQSDPEGRTKSAL